jgi:hypothetical protein
MGRETTAIVHWRGQTGEAKVLLEADELILRGGVKDRIPRAAIGDVRRTADGVALTASGAPMEIGMGGAQAGAWVKALTAAPAGLAQKLGIGPRRRAYVVGLADDSVLAEALEGSCTGELPSAAMIVAVLHSQADLDAALAAAQDAPGLALWCVHGKARHVALGEVEVRQALRKLGYIDSKSCGVSARWSATRYGLKRARSSPLD